MHEIATELRCALDPVAFAKARLTFIPDAWQARVLRSAGNVLLNCSRQAGKRHGNGCAGGPYCPL